MADLNELLDSTENKLKIDIDAKYEDQRWAKWKTLDGCGYFRWQKFFAIDRYCALDKFSSSHRKILGTDKKCHPMPSKSHRNAFRWRFGESAVGSSGWLSGALESP